MAIQSKATLKSYFQTGLKPTQTQFGDLVDSFAQLGSDGTLQLSPSGNPAVAMTQAWNGTVTSHSIVEVPAWSGAGHGPFKQLLEIHENPVAGTYNYTYSDGVFGGSGIGPTSLRTRETGYRVGGTVESHEIYDQCQHFGSGVTTHWPTPRRCGYTYSTYNTNIGEASHGTIEGKIAVDSLRVESDYANPDNAGIGAFGAYFNLQPNYQTGAFSATFAGKSAALSVNCGVGGAGVTVSSDQLLTVASQAGVTLQYAGGNSTIELGSAGVSIATNADIVISSSAASSVFRVTATTLEFPTAKDPVAFTNPGNTSTSYCSLKLASAASGDLYLGITSPAFSTGQTFLDGGAGFVQYGGTTQMAFNNVNAVDWVFANGNTQRFRVLASGGGIVVPSFSPASSSASGIAGQIAWDGSFIYVCTATNTWERVAIATW
jgi:hypothetical protein